MRLARPSKASRMQGQTGRANTVTVAPNVEAIYLFRHGVFGSGQGAVSGAVCCLGRRNEA